MVIQNTLREHCFFWPGSHSGSGGVFAELQSHMPLFKKDAYEIVVWRMCFWNVGLWLNGMVFL